jgi:hypothetical protein
MSDNDNKCPLCGKETQDNEIFCRDCREIAQNSYSEDLLPSNDEPVSEESTNENEIYPESENDTTEEAEKNNPSLEETKRDTFYSRNRKSLIVLFICLSLLIIAGFIGAYIRMQNINAEETEQTYWDECIEENTPLGYSKYLVKYPDGKFSEEAHMKIIEIRNDEQKSWENLQNSNDIDVLFAFLRDHPKTPYTREIRHAIDSLSWLAAEQQNTADVYLAYLENAEIGRINGEYISLAQERYDYLSQLKMLEGKELDEVKELMKAFFKAMSSNNNKALQKLSTDTLTVFYESKNFLSKNIADSLKSGYMAKKIKSALYTPITDSIDAILDNRGICFITLPVKKEITYIDKKKKNEQTLSVLHIELYNKRLRTIYVKNGTIRP